MPVCNKAALPLVLLSQPAFMTKAKYQFDLPAGHLATRYKAIGLEVLEFCNDENAEKVPVKSIKPYPDLKLLKTFAKNAGFSTFNPSHWKFANELIQILHGAHDLDEFISLALYVRDEINTQLFVYAYYVVMTHRFFHIVLPNPFEIAPQTFVKRSILQEVNESYHNQADEKDPKPIVVKFHTMNVTNPEERLTFFREDIGVNSHHFHWHVVYPPNGILRSMYDKDRRGELFYYMHHQMLNIYHFNRLSARVAPVVPFTNFRANIKEGYYPNMTTLTSSQNLPPRQDDTHMHDIEANDQVIQVNDIERWYERLNEAVDQGYFLDSDGNKVDLINDKGIDDFVNLLESSQLSKNSQYYGDLHNAGHLLFAHIHDPTGKYKEPPTVMSYTQTAVRDPVFFRWHQMIDNLCMKLKDRLTPYTKADLEFNGIKIQSIDLLDENNKPIDKNELITHWQQSDVDLQNGLDFRAQKPVFVRFTHLNYRSFTYEMMVDNSNASAVKGTFRIFLLPKLNEKNKQEDYEDTRKRAFELDRFVTSIPPGSIRISRKSVDSTMTIPFDQTYPNQKDEKPFSLDQPSSIQAVCMCGWPQNLLLPKGNADGYPFYLYVMISDYNSDKIVQMKSSGACNDNYVLCGLRNRKYPDKRSMGFPFDRLVSGIPINLTTFATIHDNMIAKEISIRHLSENTAQVGDNPLDIVDL